MWKVPVGKSTGPRPYLTHGLKQPDADKIYERAKAALEVGRKK